MLMLLARRDVHITGRNTACRTRNYTISVCCCLSLVWTKIAEIPLSDVSVATDFDYLCRVTYDVNKIHLRYKGNHRR